MRAGGLLQMSSLEPIYLLHYCPIHKVISAMALLPYLLPWCGGPVSNIAQLG